MLLGVFRSLIHLPLLRNILNLVWQVQHVFYGPSLETNAFSPAIQPWRATGSVYKVELVASRGSVELQVQGI
jgi:hypothetical protein